MKRGDKITLRKHPECDGVPCVIDEYEVQGRIFLHARNRECGILLALTSPDNEPWDIVTLKYNDDLTNEYEAIWRREVMTLKHFKEEI